MFVSIRKKHRQGLNVWPGFVDALAAILMAIVFILMAFVLSQLYLTDALDGSKTKITKLNQDLADLSKSFDLERTEKEKNIEKVHALQNSLNDLNTTLSGFKDQLSLERSEKDTLSNKLDLTQKDLSQTLGHLDLKASELEALQQRFETLNTTYSTLKNKHLQSIASYRSEFFSKLKKVLGNRQDIRIVGDRFVFQSEVLFSIGSDAIGRKGQQKLRDFANIIKGIMTKIPANTNWILRIDGHTDTIPIRKNNPKFPSNRALSSARALSVLNFLSLQGIPEKNMVAAGFGEYHPLNGEKDLSKNRRIEFKLDQK